MCERKIEVCENEIIPEHDEPEKCWKPTFKNDSRKWLIRDASYNKLQDPLCSTMKSTYGYPDTKAITAKRPREEMLLRQFETEAKNEIMQETSTPPVIEEYCTEYDGNYHIPGFKVDDDIHKREKELYLKYPLYRTPPTSYYSFKLTRPLTQSIPGLTKSFDKIHPFKKSSQFSTPMEAVLDNVIR